MLDILPIAAARPAAVEALLDAAFGTDRHNRTAYRLRAGTHALPDLSFAAFEDDMLVGTLQSWPIKLVGDTRDAPGRRLTMVGPVAVLPDRQREGIGLALMKALLTAADAGGEDALVLIGDAEYYGRLFGFSAEHTGGWQVPGPVERHRLLARLTSDRLHKLDGLLAPAVADLALR